MNWGKGIVTGMVLFMLFILSMCFYMFRMPQDEYDHQYYEKGLNFDQDLNKEVQVTKDHARPIIKITGKLLVVAFIDQAKGQIRFIRPSSEAMDKTIELNTGDTKKASINTSDLVPGRWKVILEWKSANKFYLYQQNIDI